MSKKTPYLLLLLTALLITGCSNASNDNKDDEKKDDIPGEIIDDDPKDPEEGEDTEEPEEPVEEEEDFSDYQELSQEGKMLFPRQSVGQGYIGDPMPYYENGKMYVYFLEDARNYRGAFHPISLLATEDYMHYEEHVRVIPFVNDRNNIDFALGTGSCVKDKNGLYHFFYTGHNSNSNTGLPYYEKVQHATSTDLINWTKLDDGFWGESNDFRDPHVLYMEDLDEYWLLVTQFKNVMGTIEKYTSKDLSHWTHQGTFYKNPKNLTHNMECSTLIKFKGYWYLSFSEQEPQRVTKYRYRKSLTEGDWIVPEVDYLDAEGLYAGKIAGDENRIFMYGWTGTKSRNNDGATYGWGGNLVGHELIQKENGELGIKAIKEVEEEVSHRYPHKTLEDEAIVTKLEVGNEDTSGYHYVAYQPFKQNRYSRMSFDYTPNSKAGSSGIMINIPSKDEYGTEAIIFDNGNNKVSFHASVKDGKFGDVTTEMPFKFENGKKIHVDFYYGDNMGVLYINGEVALSLRLYALNNKPFSIFSNSKKCVYENIKFYE